MLGLLVVMAAFIVPQFQSPLERTHLPESGERFRSMIHLTRANAMLDGLRYRIRFVGREDELYDTLSESERRQPLVECERDPIEAPDEFLPVEASWARPVTFLGDVWCYEVRFGEPTFESVLADLEEQDLEREDQLKQELGLEEDQSWVLLFEPDGTSEWMTFRLIDHPMTDFEPRRLDEYPQLDVIVDGRLGVVFLQRPLQESEIDVLLDKGHSPILRRDFMRRQLLTDEDVLEIDMRPR